MGLDYSINLYFPANRLGDAFRALERFVPPGPATLVRLCGESLHVPFSTAFKHDPVELLACGSSASFETSLLFPIDEAIAGGGYGPFEDTGCACIGYIYLKVRLGCLYAELSFTAATSGMSRLFVASGAIRGRFQELLAAAGGVVGWLDRETFEFNALDDPERNIASDAVAVVDATEQRYSPDWLATSLCQGQGRPRPEVVSIRRCRTADALALARAAKSAPELLPILADALQDAGCDSEAVLHHCRDASRAHARSCWVVDLILGRE